ncbi:autotransporter domain-containing protein [Sphingomonas sp. CJ20]
MHLSRQTGLRTAIFSGKSAGRASLLLSAAMSAITLMSGEAKAACGEPGGNIVCNGDFEVYQQVAGSDEVVFDGWVSTDPTSVRVGPGASGTNSSAEFLFSAAPFSQNLATATGDRYDVTFQYRSEGGQGFSAYFGDVKIFEYSGDEAGLIGWTEYRFNTQAFGNNTTLRFVADSLGAAQNVDLVSVVRCTTCLVNEPASLGAVIDATRPFFTTQDEAGQGTNLGAVRTVTFDGGTLRPADPTALGTATNPLALTVQVTNVGGTLDNTGQGFAITGGIVNTAASATPFVITGAGSGTVGSTITNNGTLVVASTGTTTFTGPVVNNAGGALVVNGGGVARVNGSVAGGTVIVQNGQLSVGGTVSAPVVVANSGVLRGTGTISGPTVISGALRPGNSPGTLYFSAPVSQAAGSNLVIEIDGPGTGNGAGNYSRVIVTGAGNSYTIASGATLTPVLRGITYAAGETPGTNSYNLTLGQRLQGIIQAQGGVFGTFATVVQPTAGLPTGTRIVPLYAATSVDLYVAPVSYATYTGLTANEAAAGGVIDALIVAGATTSRPLVNAVVPLGATAIAPALSSLAGQNNANLPLAAVEAGQAFTNQISARRTELAEAADGLQVWGRAFGNTARTKDDGNNPGFRSRIAGGVVGIDYGSASGLRGGVAGGFGDGNVRGADGSGRADLKSYYAGAYLGFQKDALSVNGQIGVSFNNFDSKRTATAGALTHNATAGVDGNTTSAALDIGYRIQAGKVSIEPIGFVRYDTVKVDDFVEQGADILALTARNKRYDRVAAGIGARFRADLATSGGTVIQPEAHATWRHELKDPRYALTQSLAGQSFVVGAGSPGRDAALLGAGLGAQLSSKLRLVAAYDAELAENRTGHAITGQLRIAW